MKTTRLFVAIALLSLISLSANGQSQSDANLPPYKLSAMKVVPYSQTSNSFLDEIKTDKDADFWNDLDLSLFATIEVTGKPGSYTPNRKVEIVAYAGNRLLLKRVAELGVIGESTGKYYVPVWLYGSFCQPVTIRARLIGQKPTPTLQRKLTFMCGE